MRSQDTNSENVVDSSENDHNESTSDGIDSDSGKGYNTTEDVIP